MDTNFFAFAILLASLSFCLRYVSAQRKRCESNYSCPGVLRTMAAVCKDGYCVCNNQDYDYNTCLPDAYGCKIEVNADTALAEPRYNSRHTIYSCTPGNSSTQYEVHVLAMHETPGRTGNATVNIISHGKSNRSIVLVLGSYQPVNWILSLPSNVSISKVVLIAFYLAESSVSGDVNQVETIERKSSRDSELWKWGYGSDTGGGDTVGLLKQLVCNRFGVVTSFTGTYRAYEWSLVVHSSKGSAKVRSPQCPSLAQPTETGPSLSGCKTIASVLSFLVVTVMIPAIQYVG